MCLTMTPQENPRSSDLAAAPAAADAIPAEWVIWASAIERQEDLRFRVAKRPERVRLTEAWARGATEDVAEETQEFTTQLRAGANRPELHAPAKRWARSRRKGRAS